ncbi:MAG: hypothetical protein N2652_02380 [Kiritimatiellae bacterium]|nr:hypothetical protein [Kiritimatiellia bacterium]
MLHQPMPPAGEADRTGLDDRTRRRLLEFGRRRERLLWTRGLLGAAAATLGALILVAAADAAWVIEDVPRVMLSLGAWGVGAFELWRLTLRHLRGRRDLARLARWFESARPDLREEVLSAVELGTRPPAAAGLDSPAFRARLQASVAEQLARIEPEQLLPLSLVRRWVVPAAVVLVLVALLLAWPGLQGGRRLARAALPVANLARVSRARLDVVQPTPPDATVPLGDAVTIVVEAAGRRVAEAWLDTAAGGRRARSRMKPIGAGRFAATIETTDAQLLYRARGADAVTRWYRITALPPPQIAAFEKTYRPPEWLGRPVHTVRETAGDLEGVEGTRVDLCLESDQPLRAAELRLDLDGESRVVELRPEDPRRWRTSLELVRPGLFQVRLVAADSGFENRDRPVWEIRVRPDQPPRVEIVEPAADRTATPDDVVRWAIEASDDHGLVALQRRVQVRRAGAGWRNDGAPRACTGETAVVTETTDLLALDLRPGDEVWVKYVATDLRGQTGESGVRRLMIAAESFEPGRRAVADAWRSVSDALERVSAATREARQAQLAAGRSAESETATEADRTAVRAQSLSAIRSAERAADAAAEAIRRAQAEMTTGPGADALEQIASALAMIRYAELAVARRLAAAGEDPSAARAAAEETARRLERAVELAEQAGRAAALATAAEEAELAVADLRDVSQELRRATAAPAETLADRERLARRQAVAAAHLEEIAELLGRSERRRGGFRETARKLAAVASAARSAAEAGGATQLGELARATDGALDTVLRGVADAQRDADEALRRLAEGRPRRDVLQRLAQGLAAEAPRNAAVASERLAALRDAAIAILRDRAAFEELRRDADPALVSDLQAAAAALRTVPAAPDRNAAATVERIADALRRVETAHETASTAGTLRSLAADERWGRPDDRGARARARTWRAAESALPDLERALREQQVAAAADSVNRARTLPETARAREEMERRRVAIAGRDNVADEVRATGDAVTRAAELARAAAAEARQWLASLAPPLSDRFAAAREDVRRAREAAQDAARTEEPAARASVGEALQRQLHANEEVEDLRRLLRAEAAAQDLRSPEGRERARDADVALAMLREPPPRAEDLLRAAAAAPDAARRAAALDQAAAQQARLEQTLELLADHYRKLEGGDAEGRRAELRAAEREAGLTDAMEQQYRDAAATAAMAQDPSARTPEALERMLADNPAMQAALDRLSRSMLREAADTVRRVAETEGRLARATASAAENLARARQQLPERAAELARAARALAEEALRPAARDAAAAAPEASAPLQTAAEAATTAAETMPVTEAAGLEPAAAALAQGAAQLRRAAEAARQAARSANEAVRRAEERGDREGAARGREIAQRGEGSAGRAEELARQADALAAQARTAVEGERGALAESAGSQPGLIAQTDAAGSSVERAGRHQQRLGRNAGATIAEAGRRTRATASGEMSQARDAIASANAPAAAPALETAAAAAARRAEELEQLSGLLPPPLQMPSETGRDAQTAEWLARALDQADAAAIAAEAAAQAAAAQAAAMAQARAQGLVPGEAPRQGASAQAAGLPGPDEAAAPLVRVTDDWAKLPPDIARELRNARAESVPEEYRAMVELYFKAISREGRPEPK